MPLHYELSDLRLLLILMRTRSLSASGEAAHLTTSAVSLRLRKLEDGIGAQLFTRTGKGLVPTEAGTALAEAAVPILAEAAALDARLNPFSKHDPEPLRIFSNSTGLQNFLCRIAADYLRENSSFRAVLTEQRSSLTPEAVLTGEADLGLIGGIRELSPAYRTKLELVQFVEDRHVVILPRDSSAAQQFKNRPILFAELLNLRFAALTDASPMTAAMKERALAAGFRFEPIIEAPSFSLLVELVARGPLAAVVPASAVPPNAPVEVRELEDCWAARPLAFVLPKARPALPSAIDFVEFALRTQKR